MCDMGFVYRMARIAVGLPPLIEGGGSKSGAGGNIMHATSSTASRRPVTPAEVSSVMEQLSDSNAHLKRKVERCNIEIATCVEAGRSDENIQRVIALVKERRGYGRTIASNTSMLNNLESVHASIQSNHNNSAFLDVMNRAGHMLQRTNPDEAVDRAAEVMESVRNGIQNQAAVTEAMAGDVSAQSASSDDMSIEEEVRKIFADAEARKASALIASAVMPPMGPVVHQPAGYSAAGAAPHPSAAAAASTRLSLPASAAATHPVPMPGLTAQTPQHSMIGTLPVVPLAPSAAAPYSVARPKGAGGGGSGANSFGSTSKYTNV